MTFIEQAIREAVEEGVWVPLDTLLRYTANVKCTVEGPAIKCIWSTDDWTNQMKIRIDAIDWRQTTLDPAFWQALGRARRWSEAEYSVSFGSTHPTLSTRFGGRAYTLNTWRYHWHRFIDHLAEGKDAESFFKDLLPASTHLPSGDA